LKKLVAGCRLQVEKTVVGSAESAAQQSPG
jgi:hypothetical protein